MLTMFPRARRYGVGSYAERPTPNGRDDRDRLWEHSKTLQLELCRSISFRQMLVKDIVGFIDVPDVGALGPDIC